VLPPVNYGGLLGDSDDRGIEANGAVIGEAWLYGPGRNGSRVTLPAEANACLMAAAPDLLDLLARVFTELVDDLADGADDSSVPAKSAARLWGPLHDMLLKHGHPAVATAGAS
jgi:hypothetical protein